MGWGTLGTLPGPLGRREGEAVLGIGQLQAGRDAAPPQIHMHEGFPPKQLDKAEKEPKLHWSCCRTALGCRQRCAVEGISVQAG